MRLDDSIMFAICGNTGTERRRSWEKSCAWLLLHGWLPGAQKHSQQNPAMLPPVVGSRSDGVASAIKWMGSLAELSPTLKPRILWR
jgi:hypothetical protein